MILIAAKATWISFQFCRTESLLLRESI